MSTRGQMFREGLFWGVVAIAWAAYCVLRAGLRDAGLEVELSWPPREAEDELTPMLPFVGEEAM